jgi:TetR/AcrR family transcriptional regulator
LRGDAVAQGRRRDAILASARDEFARCGFAGARIERIAAAAAVNKQLIFHYFQSKEGLYSAVTSAIFATWQSAANSEGTSPSDRLRHATIGLVRWLSENPGAAGAIADIDRSGRPGPAALPPTAVASAWLANARSLVRSVVEAGQRQGYFRDDVEPAAVAEIIAGCAVGQAIIADRDDGGEAPGARSERIAAGIAQAMVEYCAWR